MTRAPGRSLSARKPARADRNISRAAAPFARRRGWNAGSFCAALAALLVVPLPALSDAPDSLSFGSLSLRSRAAGLSLAGRARTPLLHVGPLAVRWVSHGAAHRGFDGVRTHEVAGGVRVAFSQWESAWLGLGLRRSAFLDSAMKSPEIEAGVHAHWRGAAVQVRARHRAVDVPRPPRVVFSWTAPPFFVSPPDSFPRVPFIEESEPLRTGLTSLEASIRWRRRGWEVETLTALTVARGLGPIRTAQIEATRWFGAPWGVMLGASAAAPRWLTNEASDRPSAWLGVRLEPGRAIPIAPRPGVLLPAAASRWSFRVMTLGDDLYVFRLRASDAERVALRGDFTRWEAVPLSRSSTGWWETSVRVPAGVHQIEISADGGAWQPPPGVPTTAGTYGGEVGIFVAK